MPNILDEVSESYPIVSWGVIRYSNYLAGSFSKTYGIDIDDLLQEAAIELVKCAEMNTSRISNFSGYSCVMVRNRFNKIVRSMRSLHGGSLLPDGSARLQPLDGPAGDRDKRLAGISYDSWYSRVNHYESEVFVSQLVSCLSPLHREVFCQYTGICGKDKASFDAIGIRLGFSQRWMMTTYNEARSALGCLLTLAAAPPGKFSLNQESVTALYRSSNLSPSDVAHISGGNKNAILYHLRKYGITGKRPSLSRSELKRLVPSHTPIQIAQMYGISERTVQRRASDYGISFPLNWTSRGAYQLWDFRKAKMDKAVSEGGLDISNLTKGAMRRAGVEPVLHWYRRNRASDYKDAISKLIEDLYPDHQAHHLSSYHLQ